MPPATDPSSIFDDLDEDTRVLHNKPGGGTDDLIDKAFERLRTGNGASAHAEETPKAPVSMGDTPMPPVTMGDTPKPSAAKPASPAPSQPAASRRPPVHDEATSDGPDSAPPSGQTSVWTQLPDMESAGPATERPASIPDAETRNAAPAAARAPKKRPEPLPALRVAVLATSVPGEVRLIALDPADEPPPGAAVAMLVPLTAADGESVTRLFGGLE